MGFDAAPSSLLGSTPMAPGSLGLDPMVLQQLRTRALHLVRSSRAPERCLQVMRARAAAFFHSCDLDVVGKEQSVEGARFVVRLDSAPPASMVVSDKEVSTEPVEQFSFEDKVTDENCSTFMSLRKTVPHLTVESKAAMITGCTGGEFQDINMCQDNTLMFMDIHSERNGRQAGEFGCQGWYPMFIFFFDLGEVTSTSMFSSMPLDMRYDKFGEDMDDWQGEMFKVDVRRDGKAWAIDITAAGKEAYDGRENSKETIQRHKEDGEDLNSANLRSAGSL